MSPKTSTSVEKQRVFVDWQAIKANGQHGETPLTSDLLDATANLLDIVGHHDHFAVLIYRERSTVAPRPTLDHPGATSRTDFDT
jgi:hypothetical protein